MHTVDIVGLLVPVTYVLFLVTERRCPARAFPPRPGWPWIGYLIQRPEVPCVHHRMGVHYYNYADLTVWDMVFGTFRNPREFRGECGFEAGADRKMGAMFAFADVNAPQYGAGNLGAKPRGASAVV